MSTRKVNQKVPDSQTQEPGEPGQFKELLFNWDFCSTHDESKGIFNKKDSA